MSYLKEDLSQVLLDAMLFSHDGENPSRAIEEQERRGAEKVKRFSMLPSKTNDGIPQVVKDTGITQEMRDSRDYNSMVKIQLENNKKWTRKQYENMGIRIEDDADDELFYKVILPDGWAINNTDHNMWNNVTDDKGRERFTFFYKAAFYDRDAFTNFNQRYTIVEERVIPEGITDIYEELTYEERKTLKKYICVKDADGTVLFKTEPVDQVGNYTEDYYATAPMVEECEKWLDEHYPNYKDFSAYWDD